MTTFAAAPPRELPWPDGWPRPLARGWLRVVGFGVFGLLMVLVGPAMIGTGEAAAGAGVLAFGVVCLSSVVVFWPRRRGRPVLRPPLRDTPGPPVLVLPTSRARMAISVLTCAAFSVLGVAMVLDPYGSTRRSPAAVRTFGVLSVLFFGGIAYLVLSRGLRTTGGLGLGPDGVIFTHGPRYASIAWEHLASVAAEDVGYGVGFRRTVVPVLAFRADDPGNVVTSDGRFARKVRRASRGWGGDIAVPVHTLTVDAAVAYWTARFYADHPEARAELADQRSVDRVLRRALR